MKRRVFVIGFGLSVVLLIVCASYAFSPSWKMNFELLFSRDAGYVGSPPGFRYAMAAFTILNLPAVLVAIGAIYAADAIGLLAGESRVLMVFALLLLTAFAWWSLVASCAQRRADRRGERVTAR